MSTKKKHHYVPKSYLNHWIVERPTESGKNKSGFWVINKNTKEPRFCTDLDSVSQKRYFNKLEIDQDVLDLLVYKYRDKGAAALAILNEMNVLKGINDYRDSKGFNHEKLELFNKNYLEGRYEKIESVFSITLQMINRNAHLYFDALSKGEIQLDDLMGVFSMQLFRAKKTRDSVLDGVSTIVIGKGNGESTLSEAQRENFIKAMLFIDSIVFSDALHKSRYGIEFMVNDSDEDFVTSSSPVSILEKQKSADLTGFAGFMPLGPRVAMIVRARRVESNKFIAVKVGNEIVSGLNRITYDSSNHEVYASEDRWSDANPE